MKSILQIIFICMVVAFFSQDSIAGKLQKKPKIAFIVSMNYQTESEKIPSILFSNKREIRTYYMNIKNEIKKHMGNLNNMFEIEIFPFGEAYLLNRVLTSPDYIGVYWLSHSLNDNIIDKDQFIINRVFKDIHPNLRVLGLISCHSRSVTSKIIKQYKLNKRNPKLKIYSYRKKIELLSGLENMIKHTIPQLKKELWAFGEECEPKNKNGFYMYIKRHCGGHNRKSEIYPSLTLYTKEQVNITTFPSCKRAEKFQKRVVFFPINQSDLTKRNLKIFTSAGVPTINKINDLKNYRLGELEISFEGFDDTISWEPVRDIDGLPLGNVKNMYKFNDKIERINLFKGSIFKCVI